MRIHPLSAFFLVGPAISRHGRLQRSYQRDPITLSSIQVPLCFQISVCISTAQCSSDLVLAPAVAGGNTDGDRWPGGTQPARAAAAVRSTVIGYGILPEIERRSSRGKRLVSRDTRGRARNMMFSLRLGTEAGHLAERCVYEFCTAASSPPVLAFAWLVAQRERRLPGNRENQDADGGDVCRNNRSVPSHSPLPHFMRPPKIQHNW